jgi:MSHA pilin protein MshA
METEAMYRLDHDGFAFAELAVVIAVLAILAAFAIPRFVALQTEARQASVEALAGSVRSGAALAHALWLADGRPATVSMQGRSIAMINGYPDRRTIDDTVANVSGFSYDDATGVFTKLGTHGDCFVAYSQAGSADDAPAVAVTTHGCR